MLPKHFFLLCGTKLLLFVCRSVFIGMINKESVFLLHNSLHLITAPVQVIWGKEDQVTINHKAAVWMVQISISSSACLHSQVLHVSGTAVLQAGLKDSKVELLDNCGHAIALELPRRAADIIVDFLSAQEVKRKNAKKDPWWKYLKTFGLLISCNYGIETSMMELESYEMKENVKCILTKLMSIILFTCKQKVCLMFTVQFSDARNTPTDQQEEEIFLLCFKTLCAAITFTLLPFECAIPFK